MSKESPEEFAMRHDVSFCVKCKDWGTSACQILFSAHAHTGIECFKPKVGVE